MTDASSTAPVDCANCGHANPAGAKFCGECGRPLARLIACDFCGFENPIGQRFCNECGAELHADEATPGGAAPIAKPPATAAPRTPANAERKQVSVIFCDLRGSMELAEHTDPEQWREVMEGLFQLMAESVRVFEGTVDKFTGDGLMALFGAPVAQEDHAERACHAALKMLDSMPEYAARTRESHGIELAIRIGVNSGEVVAGDIGGPETGDGYTAVGHTVGLAQRMESLAEPGSAYLTDETARLVTGHFVLEDLGPTEVKGSSEPMRVHRLVSEATNAHHGTPSDGRSATSEFVGRQSELSQLTSLLDRAIDGAGGVVAIVGEPGVGKSRLCRELVKLGDARGVSVCQARCQSHTTNVPLMPTRQLMRSYFNIPAEATDAQARETIRSALTELDPTLTNDLDIFFEFLAIPDPAAQLDDIGAEARRRRLFDLMRRVVRARSEPVLSLIEDLHWMDPASEAVFEAYAEAIKGTPTLLVTNFRPEYEGRWMQRPGVQRVPLQPLDESDVIGLLRQLLGDDASLDGLADRIYERTEGNPFFTEEMVRELVGSGVLEGVRGGYRLSRQFSELPLPASVQTVLAARIDRLTPRAKSALCAAAVAGNEFRFDLLREITGLADDAIEDALDKLVEREFIDQTTFYPDAAYMFRHPLTREVAYGTQLAATRAEVHFAVAEALQLLHPDQLEEHASLIAQHYESAGKLEQAIEWHARAASWLGFNDANAAYRQWQHVRDLADSCEADNASTDSVRLVSRMMLLMHGWRVGAEEHEARRNFSEGLAIATRRGDAISQALLHGGMGVSAGMAYGKISEFAELGDKAAELAKTVEDPAARIAILTGTLHSRTLVARYAGAIEVSDAIIEASGGDPRLGSGLTVGSPLSIAYSFRSMPLARLGHIVDARESLSEGIEIGRQVDSEALCWGMFFAFSMAANGADVADLALLELLDEATEIAHSHGDHFSVRAVTWWSGVVKSAYGDHESALRYLRDYIDLTHGGDREQVTMDRSAFAKSLTGIGEYDAALDDIESALRMVEATGCENLTPHLRSAEAVARTLRNRDNDLVLAADAIEAGRSSARTAGARLDLVELAIAEARLLRAREEDENGYQSALDAAETLASEIDARGHLRTITDLRGQTLVAG